jgi:glutamate racemase
VENGRTRPDDVVIKTVCEEYLEDMKRAGVDTLILGCTHYPLLKEVIGTCMGSDVKLVDVGAACARYVAGELEQENLLTAQTQNGGCNYYVSDTVDGFSALASRFLGRDVTGCVERVDIDKY